MRAARAGERERDRDGREGGAGAKLSRELTLAQVTRQASSAELPSEAEAPRPHRPRAAGPPRRIVYYTVPRASAWGWAWDQSPCRMAQGQGRSVNKKKSVFSSNA
eukprot:3275441-Prymnesium_polylepis.2